jgi:hypothetical protein
MGENKDYSYYNNINEITDKIKTFYENYPTAVNHKNIVLNEETLSIVIKILRILYFKKGHLILIGTNLSGKQSLSQFSSFIKKKKFVEIDESILDKTLKAEKTEKQSSKQDNLAFWNKYIKKILTEATFKGIEYVLYFGSKIMENVKN